MTAWAVGLVLVLPGSALADGVWQLSPTAMIGICDPSPCEALGSAIAVSADGRVIAAGAPKYDSHTGRARVFRLDGMMPPQEVDTNPTGGFDGGFVDDSYGSSVALASVRLDRTCRSRPGAPSARSTARAATPPQGARAA